VPVVAFLGPEGTFTAEAADRVIEVGAAAEGGGSAERRPLATIPEVFDAVRGGGADLGVVPIENLIEGSVNATLDELVFGAPGAHVRGEVLVPVSMCLLARPGTGLDALTALHSHPHALAQCRAWLTANLPGLPQLAATSTAEAARMVAEEPGHERSAALGTRSAAERFGLEVLAADVHDHQGNMTRFAVLGARMSAPTGADKTSLVVFFGEDRPGLLLRILDELALRGINLTKVESRPTKTALGEYCILIDCEGHPTDARLSEALRSLHRHAAEVKVLGAYPRADGIAADPGDADTDAAHERATTWYARVLGAID
jgi:prephenate dehydratase